jgi:DNA repair protein RecO (recombination protein O)
MVPLSQDRAYVVHLRRYTDSRVILELLTLHSGIVHAVARVPGKRDRAKFEPFHPLSVEFSGASELKTLRVCEQISEAAVHLTGVPLFCGLYLNELMQRLLRPGEPFPEIFSYYESVLHLLSLDAARADIESTLRRMEFFVLAQLGFGIDFAACATSGAEVDADSFYRFEQGKGFALVAPEAGVSASKIIPGAHLLALAKGDLSDTEVLRSAKTISRTALAPLLGAQPLKSRELFV